MYVTNVAKPLHTMAVVKCINEHILERNPVNVSSVANLLQNMAYFRGIKDHNLERNPMTVNNGAKHFQDKANFTCKICTRLALLLTLTSVSGHCSFVFCLFFVVVFFSFSILYPHLLPVDSLPIRR